MSRKPDWAREGAAWPNREASRFIAAGGVRWHVQIMGSGPPLLLIHGAGAATHSWRDVAPRLARAFTVIAPDLPGHGFTSTPSRDGLSLPGMARALHALLAVLEMTPDFAVAHSAGAGIALHMRLKGGIGDGGIVCLNGALRPYGGSAGQAVSLLSRVLFLNPVTVELFALRARRPGAVARLIENTGSKIDEAGLALYRRLISCTGHIEGALGMMAHWDLKPLLAEMPRLSGPVTLVAAEKDRAVPPSVARDAQALIPGSVLVSLPGLGHLAHEEAPEGVVNIIREAFGIHAEPPAPMGGSRGARSERDCR
jgi:magnesium chelatase accessory protein